MSFEYPFQGIPVEEQLPEQKNMYKRINFPPEALDDVRQLMLLPEAKLTTLADLLESSDGVHLGDDSIIPMLEEILEISTLEAERIAQFCFALQFVPLTSEQAAEVVDDLKELVTREADGDTRQLIETIDSQRDTLIRIATQKSQIARILKVRKLTAGTHEHLNDVRTVVELRPVYHRNEDDEPDSIECLVPAMTIELKFGEDDSEQTAAFELTKDALELIIVRLIDASKKWEILEQEFSDRICR